MKRENKYVLVKGSENQAREQASHSRRASESESSDSSVKAKAVGPKILAVTSGKGGVGKTNIVANLAFSLSELGKKVVILDADFGLANIDVLLGLTPRFHLGHVLFGNKALSEIIVQGPKGIRIIPASSGLQRLSELTSEQKNFLVSSFSRLDSDTDFFLIDTAAGISRNVIHFLLSAHEVIVVSAPEPTAIVDAYAVIKIILAEDHNKPIHLLINSVERAEEAQRIFCQINSVVKRFLGREVAYLGHVSRDPHILQAVRNQVLVTSKFPNAPASSCFRELAAYIAKENNSPVTKDVLVWDKLLTDWVN